jgi:cholesterol oxidase
LDAKNKLRPEFGPVITTAIRYPDSLDGDGEVGRGFYVEDGGNPYLLSWMVEISGVLGLLRRAVRFLWYTLLTKLRLARAPDLGYRFAKLLGSCRTSSHAMPVLVMGRDVPSGKFSLNDGILDCDWTVKPSARYHERVARELGKIAAAIGAKYVENPLWRFDFQKVLTAHPLGGCPMARNPQDGVVNDWGEVFGYPGLYVADGSTMPGPVGPNPSLTIAAFADRVADGIIAQPRP